jgi:hypothetical protein
MSKPIKAASIVKLGYIMLILNMVCAGGAYYLGDHTRTTMFLVGSCFWIVVSLVWARNVEQGD